MRKRLLLLVLLASGCQERGALNARCMDDGLCLGKLVCIHRETYDKVHGYNAHSYVCVLPSEVRQ